MHPLTTFCYFSVALLFLPLSAQSAGEPTSEKFAYKDASPQRYKLSARASKLDSRTKEYPKIGFVFGDDKKPQDLQNAIVDTSVA
ncbi:MAG: hypothetical protein GXP30_01035, partial [Verrucomicrobia bacterium]|nr:hypothetical protein [Verrucomicrobiota bacterium]